MDTFTRIVDEADAGTVVTQICPAFSAVTFWGPTVAESMSSNANGICVVAVFIASL